MCAPLDVYEMSPLRGVTDPQVEDAQLYLNVVVLSSPLSP